MAIEPERIRVDLLKLKRKIYMSYAYGSKERKDFLLKTKLSEIALLSKLLPEETATYVFEAYKKVLRLEIVNIFIALCGGGCLSVLLTALHQIYPNNPWFAGVWYMPLIVGACFAGSHIKHIIDQWQGLKPFKAEYEKIQEKIKKLRKDTKSLE